MSCLYVVYVCCQWFDVCFQVCLMADQLTICFYSFLTGSALLYPCWVDVNCLLLMINVFWLLIGWQDSDQFCEKSASELWKVENC